MLNSLRIRPCLVMLLAGTLAACGQQEAAPETNVAEEAATNLPAVPAPQPPIDRAALLAAIAQAASATAAGQGVPESLQRLDGREFELRIRFGCSGASTALSGQSLGWGFDPEKRTLRVRARPTISKEEPLVAAIAGEDVERVEGFWIPRPWLIQPLCPAGAAVQASAAAEDDPADGEDEASEPVPAAPRIGIAQFFTSSDARTRRRAMRPYEAVKTMSEGAPISSQGFDLVLSGRLRALPGRGVIACSARNADSPPECIVSAQFQHVWIEQPETGEVIADWGSG